MLNRGKQKNKTSNEKKRLKQKKEKKGIIKQKQEKILTTTAHPNVIMDMVYI